MAKRAGTTRKVSISVGARDFAVVKARAKRMHGGNVSAVFAELIATLKRQEAWEKLMAWYGKPIEMTPEERDEIDAQLFGRPLPKTPKRRRAA